MPTVASTLLGDLWRRGVRQIFGVVGREAQSILFDEQEGIEFVLTRHEFTAGVMADALARLTGQPQVCFSTLGPGVTNMATAVASACLDRSPVIALAAQVETDDLVPNHTHQCVDNVGVMRPLTKFAAELTRPEELLELLDQAFEASMTEPLGPSFISLPIDLLGATVPAEEALAAGGPAPELHVVEPPGAEDWRSRLDAAVRLVRSSRQPLIMVGGAAVRAGISDTIRTLCEASGIPMVTSYPAMGILPPRHPLNYGAITVYLDGLLGCPALDAIFGPVDVLLSVGFDYAEDLRPPMWERGLPKRFVRVASVPNPVPGVLQPDLEVVGPLREAATELTAALASARPRGGHDVGMVRRRRAEMLADRDEHPGGILASQVVASVNEVLGDGILVTDVGLYRHVAVALAEISRAGGFLTSDGCSTFGFGLPAAMAARIAHPELPVILLAGDGGFHSNNQDLETAVRCRLPVLIVVLENRRSELIRLYQDLGHGRSHLPAVAFGPVDFVALARAQGCRGVRVDRLADLPPALRDGLAQDGPFLVEVPVLYQGEGSVNPVPGW
jgi:N2-(2-carboxyethyl)arginine synthase